MEVHTQQIVVIMRGMYVHMYVRACEGKACKKSQRLPTLLRTKEEAFVGMKSYMQTVG